MTLARRHLRPWLTLLLAFVLPVLLRGQDVHFTQVDVNPILLNPAYSGFFDGKGRFGIVYRNQWATVSSPFQSIAASGEFSMLRRRYYRDGLSIGLYALSDRAGSLSYGTSAATAVLSYFKALGNGNTLISIAGEVGGAQSGYDPSNAQFENPEDDLSSYSVSYPLLGAGFAMHIKASDILALRFGLSGHNLNRPNISYLGLDDTFLERRFNGYFRMDYRAWPTVSLLPLAVLQLQNNNTEILTGCDAKWFLSEANNDFLSFSAGLHYRWLDALLVALSVEYNAWVFGLNYDANISKLTPASKSIGSFEMQVVYRLLNHHTPQHKALPCPII